MVILVQYACGPWHEAMLRASSDWHAGYCARHGFAYSKTVGSIPDVHPAWGKVVRLAEAVDVAADGDLVVWLDADACVIDPTVSLAAAWPQGVIGGVFNKGGAMNAGAVWFRVGTETRGYIHRVLSHGPTVSDGRVRDHAAFNTTFGDIVPLRLDSRWNHYEYEETPPSEPVVIQAWHNYDRSVALSRVKDAVGTARRYHG